MKSTQVGVAVLTKDERERRAERAARRTLERQEEEARRAAEALAKELAAKRAADAGLAAIDAQRATVTNRRVKQGGKA